MNKPQISLVVNNTTVDPPPRDLYLYTVGDLLTLIELEIEANGQNSPRVLRLQSVVDVLTGLYGLTKRAEISDFLEQFAARDTEVERPANTTPTPVAPAPDLDTTALDREIERREIHLADITEVGGDCEERLAALEAQIQELEGRLEYADKPEKLTLRREIEAIEKQCSAIKGGPRAEIVRLGEAAKKELAELTRLRQSRLEAASPLPAHLMGATLPDVRHFSFESSSPEEPSGALPAPASTSSDRRVLLDVIATEQGISPIKVFIYSLFDLFGEGNKRLHDTENKKPLNRTTIRVVRTALSVMPGFGWSNFREAMQDDTEMNPESVAAREYLEFRGKVAGKHSSYLRTAVPLPWDTSTLFEKDEVTRFVLEMQ